MEKCLTRYAILTPRLRLRNPAAPTCINPEMETLVHLQVPLGYLTPLTVKKVRPNQCPNRDESRHTCSTLVPRTHPIIVLAISITVALLLPRWWHPEFHGIQNDPRSPHEPTSHLNCGERYRSGPLDELRLVVIYARIAQNRTSVQSPLNGNIHHQIVTSRFRIHSPRRSFHSFCGLCLYYTHAVLSKFQEMHFNVTTFFVALFVLFSSAPHLRNPESGLTFTLTPLAALAFAAPVVPAGEISKQVCGVSGCQLSETSECRRLSKRMIA